MPITLDNFLIENYFITQSTGKAIVMKNIGVILILFVYFISYISNAHADVESYKVKPYDKNSLNISKQDIFKISNNNVVLKSILKGKYKHDLPFNISNINRNNIKQKSYLLMRLKKNKSELMFNYNLIF